MQRGSRHRKQAVQFHPCHLSVAIALISGCLNPAFAIEPVQLNTIEVKSSPDNGYIVPSVTAGTRTDTPIEHIPQSVVTIPKAIIEDQGLKTLSDALRNVSNVTAIDPRDANNVMFRIRGFSAGTVVDGAAIPGYFPAQESLVNVERLDVVKGPSGALFGNSQGVGSYPTVGGTIAVTTAAPVAGERFGEVGLHAGSYHDKGVNLDVNQPFTEEVAARLTGEWSASDSETDRVSFKRVALFPSLAFTPDDSTRVVVRLRYLDNTTLDYSGLPVSGTLDTSLFTLPRSSMIAVDGQPDTETKSRGINVQWTEKLNADWAFSLTMSHNTSEIDQFGSWAESVPMPGFECFMFGTVAPAGNSMCEARMIDEFKTTSVSPALTGHFRSGSLEHTLSVGVDYEKTTDDASMLWQPVAGSVNLSNPVYPSWVNIAAPSSPYQQNTYEAKVAYVQDQVSLGKVHVLGSLRYSDISVDDVSTDPLMAMMGPLPNNHTTNRKVTPRIGAVYDLSPKMSVFAGYSEGIKVPTVSVFTTPPKPEEAVQKEVGLRLKQTEKISATLAFFDLVRRNVAVSDPAHPGYSIQAGEQQSKGVDLDVRWQITNALTGMAALTSQTAKITESSNAALLNKQLFNVPEKTARLAARYDIRTGTLAGVGIGLGASYHSELPGNSTNTFFTPSATVWDSQFSYTIQKMRFGLDVNNLLNKKYYVPSNYFGGGQVIPAQPRTVTATATFSF